MTANYNNYDGNYYSSDKIFNDPLSTSKSPATRLSPILNNSTNNNNATIGDESKLDDLFDLTKSQENDTLQTKRSYALYFLYIFSLADD